MRRKRRRGGEDEEEEEDEEDEEEAAEALRLRVEDQQDAEEDERQRLAPDMLQVQNEAAVAAWSRPWGRHARPASSSSAAGADDRPAAVYYGLANWLDLIAEAKEYVYLRAAWSDVADIVHELIVARQRDLAVRVALHREQGDSVPAENSGPVVQRLRSHGVQLRLAGPCNLHAKALLTDTGVLTTSRTRAS